MITFWLDTQHIAYTAYIRCQYNTWSSRAKMSRQKIEQCWSTALSSLTDCNWQCLYWTNPYLAFKLFALFACFSTEFLFWTHHEVWELIMSCLHNVVCHCKWLHSSRMNELNTWRSNPWRDTLAILSSIALNESVWPSCWLWFASAVNSIPSSTYNMHDIMIIINIDDIMMQQSWWSSPQSNKALRSVGDKCIGEIVTNFMIAHGSSFHTPSLADIHNAHHSQFWAL